MSYNNINKIDNSRSDFKVSSMLQEPITLKSEYKGKLENCTNENHLYFTLNKLKNCSKEEIQKLIDSGKLSLSKEYNAYFCTCYLHIFNHYHSTVYRLGYVVGSEFLINIDDTDFIMYIIDKAVSGIEADNLKKEDSNNNENSLQNELYRRVYGDQCL